MHNHDDKKDSPMWWMMLMCAIPLIILLFAGGTLFSSGSLWPILIGVFVIAHFWMMFRGHGGHKNTDNNKKSDANLEKQPEEKNEHKHGGGCCH